MLSNTTGHPSTPAHIFNRPLTLERIEATQTLLLDVVDCFARQNVNNPFTLDCELLTYWVLTPSVEILAGIDHSEFQRTCRLIEQLTSLFQSGREDQCHD